MILVKQNQVEVSRDNAYLLPVLCLSVGCVCLPAPRHQMPFELPCCLQPGPPAAAPEGSGWPIGPRWASRSTI